MRQILYSISLPTVPNYLTTDSRRVLAKWILERADLQKGLVWRSSLIASPQDGVVYVLVIGHGDEGKNHSEYRRGRLAELNGRVSQLKP
jgi:hypothetical protein